jgi:hypothetical protein
MGYGGSGHDGAYLTDSLVVMSLMPQSHHTTLVSVPRDLWIQYPPNSGNYDKINAVYPIASNNNADPVAGGDAAAQKVSLVTGLDVKYWITIHSSIRTAYRALLLFHRLVFGTEPIYNLRQKLNQATQAPQSSFNGVVHMFETQEEL